MVWDFGGMVEVAWGKRKALMIATAFSVDTYYDYNPTRSTG